MDTVWTVRVQIMEGSLCESENVYTFTDKGAARAAALAACDFLEESDDVTEINGEEVS